MMGRDAKTIYRVSQKTKSIEIMYCLNLNALALSYPRVNERLTYHVIISIGNHAVASTIRD